MNAVHGLCADCDQPVEGGQGVTVDAEGAYWHTDCRRVFLRKNQGEVKRGPGRPRKTEVAA